MRSKQSGPYMKIEQESEGLGALEPLSVSVSESRFQPVTTPVERQPPLGESSHWRVSVSPPESES